MSVADGVKAQLDAIFAGQPDLKYFIPNDQSTAVKQSTNGALEELLIAAISAMLVVLLFFRDLRNTLVTVAGLPVTCTSSSGSTRTRCSSGRAATCTRPSRSR